MQCPTEARRANGGATTEAHGDEDGLYRRHHSELERAVARAVDAPRELIEDACQDAWALLLRSQPDRYAVFGWLRVVAIHEAYRLSAIERRDARIEGLLGDNGDSGDAVAAPQSLEAMLEVREALSLLAALPERQRNDLTLLVAGIAIAKSPNSPAVAPSRTSTSTS